MTIAKREMITLKVIECFVSERSSGSNYFDGRVKKKLTKTKLA